MTDQPTAPFPYFGGKARVAPLVWQAIGADVKHYIEPFFGSGAVLLARPGHKPREHTESVCDKDGHLANVWRALQADPDAVARHCDWPVNHADLNARRRVLNAEAAGLIDRLCADEKYYDARLAGFWVWAASCWIGSGLTCPNARPHIGERGAGVHRVGKIPHISDAGRGVQEPYNTTIYEWFRDLSERLRYVRVVCGDWTRVCGGNWQDNLGPCGMFFDPPYGAAATRDPGLYAQDSLTVADEVREWCLKRGENERYRIVLAGYFEEHEALLACGWTVHKWSAAGGYSRIGNGAGKEKRHREALFFSPHCINNIGAEEDLFSGLEDDE